MEIETVDNPTQAAPVLVDANAVVAGIFAKLPSYVQSQAAPIAPQIVESEYEKTRQRLLDNQNIDAPTAQVLDLLLDAKIKDKERADATLRRQEQERNQQTNNQQALKQRSDSAMSEVDKMISRFGAGNALVSRSKESIKKNVAAAFDADPKLVTRFQNGDVDYEALEKLTIKEVNEYLPETQRKQAGGPAIKTESPGQTKVASKVDIDNLDEKGREFVTAQVNFWKKQPGYDLEKANAKAVETYQAAEDKRKSKK